MGLSMSKLQDYVANFGKDEILSITSDQLSDFKQLIHDAINKIMTTEHYQEVREKMSLMGSEQERLITFLEFVQGKDIIEAICKIFLTTKFAPNQTLFTKNQQLRVPEPAF